MGGIPPSTGRAALNERLFARLCCLMLLVAVCGLVTGCGDRISSEENRSTLKIVDDAIADLDSLWRGASSAAQIQGAQDYTSPRSVDGYDPDHPPSTTCQQVSWHDKAFYCPADQTILYDEGWFEELASEFGDFAPALVLAHEWGHHAQWVLAQEAKSIGNELQADCFAGMWLSTTGLVLDRSPAGEEEGMLSAVSTFFAIGDQHYKESEWFAAGIHGSPQQRVMAVSTGITSQQEIVAPSGSMATGLPFCIGYRDFSPSDVAFVGPYRFVELPGRASETDGNLYTMSADDKTGLPSSTVMMDWEPRTASSPAEALSEVWTSADFEGIRPVSEPFDVSHVTPGTGSFFERTNPEEGSVMSGLLAIIVPTDGSGRLHLFVYRPGPAPADPVDEHDLATIEEQLLTLYQILGRLCPLIESQASASLIHPACLDNQ